MSFFQIFCYDLVGASIGIFLLIWFSSVVLDKKPMRRFGLVRLLGLSALIMICMAALGALFYYHGLFSYNMGRALCYYLGLLLEMLFLRKLYEERYLACWITSVFFEIVNIFTSNIAASFLQHKEFHMDILAERLMYFFIFMVGPAPLLYAVIILVIHKTGLGRMLGSWISQGRKKPMAVLFISLFPMWEEFIYRIVQIGQFPKGNSMLSVLFLLALGIVFWYAWRGEVYERQILEQQVNLRQQDSYIESLEEMQQEMRRFRHDFKNMMSGMYLQAGEGDFKAVQEFIQNMTEDFDSQVGSRILQTTQLGNIHMTAIKGLLMEKSGSLQKEGICCRIEALRPFDGTRMRSTDLCRCLGILIDNAADEVRGREGATVHVMISSQESVTTFRVKNRLYSAVDFHKIWEEGYSTRGLERGIGLANYRRILEGYDYVVPFTSIQDGEFVQEFKVKE